MSGSETEEVDTPPPEVEAPPPGPEASQSKSKVDKKWKLKNADMRVLDVITKQTASSSSSSYLVIKMEFILKNQAEENATKVAGEYPSFFVRHHLYSFSVCNTPGTRVGPGFRDRTLAVKSRKNKQKLFFFVKN